MRNGGTKRKRKSWLVELYAQSPGMVTSPPPPPPEKEEIKRERGGGEREGWMEGGREGERERETD